MESNEQPRPMQNPEPRFYPTFAMKVDTDSWRALAQSERLSRGLNFSDEIKRLLFARVQEIHPVWSREQHEMMFFRLLYAGEHFEEFAREKIKRHHWQEDEVEAVRATPIPLSREASEPYAAIFHPDVDEAQILWPHVAERGTNI